MSTDNARTAEPTAEDFAGQSAAVTLRRLFYATRPKFYPASVLPVLVGSGWGFLAGGQFDLTAFLLALFATVCVHAGANVLNDVGDETIGTDRRNTDRIYPYTGGSRFIQNGILTTAGMARLGAGLLALATVLGIALIVLNGLMVLWLGLAGVALAVLYSLGPARLSATGFGELAVGIAFGVIPVVGSAWLQSGVIDASVIIFSLPVSAWVAAILLINEVPDVAADSETGKRTLPVRLGLPGTAWLYLGLHIVAVLAVVLLTIERSLPLAAPLVPLLLLALAGKAMRAIPAGVNDRLAMTTAIEATLGIHTIGSLWLVATVLFAAFRGLA